MVKKKNRFAKKFIKKKKQTRGEAYAVLSPEERNREYFQALGSTRASVQMLGTAWAGLFFLCVELLHIYFFIKSQFSEEPFYHPVILFLGVCAFFMLICLLVVLDKSFIYNHQKFGTVMLFLMINILLLSLVMAGYILIILSNNALMVTLVPSIIFWLASTSLYLVLLFYNFKWLKEQLKNGFSEERTNANFLAAASVYSSGSLWLILGLTLLGGVGALVFTQSWDGVMGILFNILFISAFSRLIVEVGYLTYLRFKDKSYWEEMPEELENQTLRTVLDIRKTAPRLIIEVILFLGLGISEQLFNIDDHHQVWLWLFRGMFYILAIDGSIAFIIHKIKQRKESK